MKVLHRRIGAQAAALVLSLAWALTHAAPPREDRATPSRDPALDAVLSRFDQVQQNVRSLSADFTQTTVNPLFKEPMSSKGRFYMRKPDSVLWEYTFPEAMQFAIDKDEYTGYFPGRKKAERRDVHRWSEQIFRCFEVGQVSAELRKFYGIRLEDQGSNMNGTYLLVLDPTRRRVRKRVEEVRFWVDATTCLPAKVVYVNKEGATRTIVFHNVLLNPDLSASLFSVRIPSDVTVTTGFTDLGSAGAPSATH